MSASETKIVKGNRLEKLADGSGTCTGYRIHTGPTGTEGDESSFCGNARVLEFPMDEYQNLNVYPQGVCSSVPTWPAWILTYEVSTGGKSESAASPAASEAQPESPNPYNDPSRPGSFWRKKKG